MDRFLNKSYKVVEKSKNFDEFFSIIGINWFESKVAKVLPTTTTLVKLEDGFYGCLTDVGLFTRVQKFQPNVEITQMSVEGRLIRNIFAIEGNKLIETQLADKKIIFVREYFDDKMATTVTCGNFVMTTVSRVVDD